ncbi:hypothetical protein HQ397_05995 [Aeromonas hydrophila]|nr:hypothetical protein [Aeromonas hydrophila]QWL69735.1 hypothetical protein HQ397_05995 [Aeromonas hydrophila]
MSKTKEVLIALVKSKPLYALLATLLTTLGMTQGEAVAGHLQALMVHMVP